MNCDLCGTLVKVAGGHVTKYYEALKQDESQALAAKLFKQVQEQAEIIEGMRSALEWVESFEYKFVPSHWENIAKEQSRVARECLAKLGREKG